MRVFVGAFTDKGILSNKPSSFAVAKHASLYGELAKVFKKDLVDPLDKPANRKETYKRIRTFMIENMFSYEWSNINESCA